jgi:HNH endonuclease/AP2 domain
MPQEFTTKTIPLSQGLVATIDEADFDLVSGYNWRAICPDKVWYAMTSSPINGTRHYLYLHRLLMGTPFGVLVDHRDGNGLNCVRSNLRIATQSQNNCNRGKESTNKSGYKGVSWDKVNKKWLAHIQFHRLHINLGRYVDVVDAARAYDAGARKHHGEFAKTNFPD